MPRYRTALPQLSGDIFLADGSRWELGSPRDVTADTGAERKIPFDQLAPVSKPTSSSTMKLRFASSRLTRFCLRPRDALPKRNTSRPSCELEPAGVPQHVGMDKKGEFRGPRPYLIVRRSRQGWTARPDIFRFTERSEYVAAQDERLVLRLSRVTTCCSATRSLCRR
jgi:hypothetical protein